MKACTCNGVDLHCGIATTEFKYLNTSSITTLNHTQDF